MVGGYILFELNVNTTTSEKQSISGIYNKAVVLYKTGKNIFINFNGIKTYARISISTNNEKYILSVVAQSGIFTYTIDTDDTIQFGVN